MEEMADSDTNKILRVIFYVDGANFYHCLSEDPKNSSEFFIDLKKFCDKSLFDKEKYPNQKIIKINYYNAPFTEKNNPKLYKKQQSYFEMLRNNGIFLHLFERNNFNKIKGDDIGIAVDVLSDAYENQFDLAYIISSDSDFKPLFEKLNSIKKDFSIIYFEKQCSLSLLDLISNKRKISHSMIRNSLISYK
jgi:uncharacterized LabA/DUF88 family protein